MTIAEKIARAKTDYDEVYDAGYAKGQAEGGDTTAAYDEGFEAGKKAEYDAFWDEYQENGNRIKYGCAFAGVGWNDKTFKPKYDIRPTEASRFLSGTGITDFKGALEKAGVVFDLSKAISISYITDASNTLTRLPELNTTSCASLLYFVYQASNLVSIDKVILKNDGSQKIGAQTFGYLTSLEEIRFEGVIGQNGLNLQHSMLLSKASIESIINALSTTTSGLAVTLSKTAVNNAFTADEREALIATRTNWTISLV